MFLYLVTNGKQDYKIGVAKNPNKRLSQLNVGSPNRLSFVLLAKFDKAEQAIESEKIIHDQLSNKHLNGEWFTLQPFEVRAISLLFIDAVLRSPTTYEPQPVKIHKVEKPFIGDEEYYDKAIELVRQTGKASTSYLQRKLSIGYNRAAKIMDRLEEEGVVGLLNGTKARAVSPVV